MRIARRKARESERPGAKVAKHLSVPVLATRSSSQANRPHRIQRLKHFRLVLRHDHFLDAIGGKTGDGCTLGFVHGFDFVEVVVHGAPPLTVDRERLVSGLTRVQDRSIQLLHVSIEPGDIERRAAIDGRVAGEFTGSPALQTNRTGVDALQRQIRGGGNSQLDRKMSFRLGPIFGLGPHQVLARSQPFGDVSAVLAGAHHRADPLHLGAEHHARALNRMAVHVLDRTLDRARGGLLGRRRGLLGRRSLLSDR